MIIAVSDVHLGYEKSLPKDFKAFIEYVSTTLTSDDHLVLLGDILDFWRRNNVSVALEHQDILLRLQSLNTNVHYIVGNHDYLILNLAEKVGKAYPFEVRKNLRLFDSGKYFYFTHGYELEVLTNLEPLTVENYEIISINLCQMTEAFLGSILSALWESLQVTFKKGDLKLQSIHSIIKPPEKRKMDKVETFAKSDIRRLFLGLMKDDALIFGHTHSPFIYENVANTGSWVSDTTEHNTYIVIKDGKMSKHSY